MPHYLSLMNGSTPFETKKSSFESSNGSAGFRLEILGIRDLSEVAFRNIEFISDQDIESTT